MLRALKKYAVVDKSMKNLITVEFFAQLINVSFIAILPLYMKAEHFTDVEYAHFTSYRYLGMLSLALFVGMYIKGRKILPFFYIAAIGLPLFALLILIGVAIHSTELLLISHLLWGVSYTFIQIPILPYILRNTHKRQHTLVITMHFVVWSIASISSGLIISVFNRINKELFNECNLLFTLVIASFMGIYFVTRVNKNEYVPIIKEKRSNLKEYDWKIIIRALTPTAILAIGAGFTIPFMSLFFSNVHNMSTSSFSFLNFITAILVASLTIYIPNIKEKYGYQKAIPITQSIAIIALIIMTTTQYYSYLNIAIYIAGLFYILRQPFMSAAVPLTTEITMKYVGERNQEMASALTSSIWSGTAYFSAIAFGILRQLNYSYATIFWITAIMYSIGVIMFYLLVVDYNKKEKLGLIT
ncbi:MAG: MFS transporter [Bacteroidia bacterium]